MDRVVQRTSPSRVVRTMPLISHILVSFTQFIDIRQSGLPSVYDKQRRKKITWIYKRGVPFMEIPLMSEFALSSQLESKDREIPSK